MRKQNKHLALLLVATILATSTNYTPKASASELNQNNNAASTVSSGAITATPTAIGTLTPNVTQTPNTTTSPIVTTGAVITTAPAVATDTSVSNTTGSSIATSSSIVHNVGETITLGNYTYTVSQAPTDTTNGTVTLKGVVSTSLTKTSLTVAGSIAIDGYRYKITEIGARAFKSCRKLKTITINTGVSVIKTGAFRGITTLNQVNLPVSLTFIQANAFYGCTGLRQIMLPAKMTTIGKKAFYNCKNLKAIFVKGTAIKTIKTKAFYNIKSGSYMVVPSGKKTYYKTRVTNSGTSKMTYYTY